MYRARNWNCPPLLFRGGIAPIPRLLFNNIFLSFKLKIQCSTSKNSSDQIIDLWGGVPEITMFVNMEGREGLGASPRGQKCVTATHFAHKNSNALLVSV